MENVVLCSKDAGPKERWLRALEAEEETACESIKERTGMVAEFDSAELQYRRIKTSKLIFCAVR
jgi:hypothetical protein